MTRENALRVGIDFTKCHGFHASPFKPKGETANA